MNPKYLTTCILSILCIMAIMAGTSFAADINVTVNESFNITLSSNPSTGYSWRADYDETYLELVDDIFQPGSGIGAPGNRTFVFQALQPGETSINFTYQFFNGAIGNTTNYTVAIAGVTPANNTINNTNNVTPSTDNVPMQDTGIPLVVLTTGVLSLTAGVIASKRK